MTRLPLAVMLVFTLGVYAAGIITTVQKASAMRDCDDACIAEYLP